MGITDWGFFRRPDLTISSRATAFTRITFGAVFFHWPRLCPCASRWPPRLVGTTCEMARRAANVLADAPDADFAPGAFIFSQVPTESGRACRQAILCLTRKHRLQLPAAKSSSARSRPLNSRASKRRSRYNSRKYSSAGRSPLLELHSTQHDTRLR